ncbi:MAG: hypothetical protein H7Z17_00035, partial [Fuerstia sp.]|nr:hypothetical protein [Fuerstiella sp.]
EAAGKSLPLEHSGWSASVAFSDDGTILASGSGRKSVNVYDIQTRTLLYEIADQPHVVTDVWFSPKSRYLVTKCPNGSKNREDLRLWDARTGEPITPLIDEGDIGIDHIAFSRDGTLAAVERHNLQHVQQNAQVGGGGTVEIWDLDTKRMVSQVKAGNADDAVFQSFCFAPDGKSLLTNSSDTLDTCDVATGQLLSSVPLGRILQDIQIEADQLLVLTTVPKKSDEYALKKINTSTNAIEDLGTVPYCEFLAVSRDGRWLAFRDRSLPGSQLTIWDCQRHCLHDILKSHQQAINGAVFASNSRTLITVSLDMTVRFRDVETKQEIGIIRGHTQPIFAVDLSPKEDWLVTGAGDPFHGVGSGKMGELFLWNAAVTANVVAGVQGGPELPEQNRWEILNVAATVNSCEYSGDGRFLAIAHRFPHQRSDNSTPAIVDIWNTQDGTCVDSISPFTGVAHICLTHDGRKIAAARRLERTRTFVEKDGERIELPPAPEPQTVVVHELGSQPEDWLFDVDFEEAHALCFSQDGTGLLVAGSAGK